MPTYSFRNKETGETFDKMLSFSGKDEFLESNPNIEQIITQAPGLGDPTKMSSTRKIHGGFKETLQRIDQRTPGSQLKKNSDIL